MTLAKLMRERGVPMTRANYIYVRWGCYPYPWTAAHERKLPRELRLRVFDESQHPRIPAGDPDGGQFTSGGGGGAPAGSQLEMWPGLFPPLTGPKKKTEWEDFVKDEIPLDASTRIDVEKQKKFVELWNERVDEAPHDFRNRFLGGLKGTMRMEFDDYGGTLEVRGDLKGDDDTTIGNYTRTLDFKNNKASSDYFKLTSSQTGKDIGKRMLAANVAMYQQLGFDHVEVHANIDVGGYAWAKYGYVPTDSSWGDLSSDLLEKVGGGSSYEPSSWDELSSDQQDNIRAAWKRDTQDEFEQSEIENWHESGRALDDAKVKLADEFDSKAQWANNAVDKWRTKTETTLTNEQILDAVSVDYRSRHGDGRDDPDITIDELAGIDADALDDLNTALVNSFNGRAQDLEGEMDPPNLSDSIDDIQNDFWENMRDRDKFQWASDNGALPTEGESGGGEIDDPDAAEGLRSLIENGDPKAIWAISDSEYGKTLLLGTDWNGELDLHDKETMDRFNAYIGKDKPRAAAA